jgi:predicted small metal-binding protein
MAKTLACRDLGLDCDFIAMGEDADEVLASAADHAEEAHGINVMPPELLEEARAAIKSE